MEKENQNGLSKGVRRPPIIYYTREGVAAHIVTTITTPWLIIKMN